MEYSGNGPFLIISLLQTVFALFFYGGLNVTLGLVSLFLTCCLYIFKKEFFFLLNCLLSLCMLMRASQNPMLSNSAMLLSLSSLVFILSFCKKSEKRDFNITIIMFVGVAYFVSGVHKMNTGFFYSSSSCAGSYLKILLSKFGVQDVSGITSIVAFLIVIFELFLGFSFFIPRLRAMSFCLIVAFHTVASFANPVVEPFGNLMISLVAVSFWSQENTDRAPAFWKLIVFCVILILIDFYLHHLGLIKVNIFPGFFTILYFMFLYKSGLIETMKRTKFKLRFTNLLLPLFYFLFCLGGPYVGYRETGSLNMYSNLVPSSQESNHFFLGQALPKLVDPWSYRIKIYEIKYDNRVIYSGDSVVVADQFNNQVSTFLKAASLNLNDQKVAEKLKLRLKLFGKPFQGSFVEAAQLIAKSNGLILVLISRVTIPLMDENYHNSTRGCEW